MGGLSAEALCEGRLSQFAHHNLSRIRFLESDAGGLDENLDLGFSVSAEKTEYGRSEPASGQDARGAPQGVIAGPLLRIRCESGLSGKGNAAPDGSGNGPASLLHLVHFRADAHRPRLPSPVDSRKRFYGALFIHNISLSRRRYTKFSRYD